MIIALVVFSYLLLSGMAYPLVYKKVISQCPFTGHERANGHGKPVVVPCKTKHKPEAITYSIAGPFIMPFLMGAAVTNRESRIEARQARELSAANHKLEIAKIERQQMLELERNLKD